ncbi:MAG: SdrD B-like domain-containing protein, partial [Chloroflexota bacterium]
IDISCDGGNAQIDLLNRSAELTLIGGDNVTCTFTNQLVSTQLIATVYHDLDLDGQLTSGDEPLAGWEVSVLDAQGTPLTDAQETGADGQVLFNGLATGTVQVCETLSVGWYNTDPGSGVDPIVGSGQSICRNVELIAGQISQTTFGNVAAASLIVAKETQPVGATGPFMFTSAVVGLNGGIGDGEQLSASVFPGSYTVTEAEPGDEFELTAVVCDDADSTGDLVTHSATFQADAGETVVCTFTNTQAPGTAIAFVYEDLDQSGDYSDGDKPLMDWTVRIRDGAANQIGSDMMTDAAGMAIFGALPGGDYQVCQDLPTDWDNTDPGDEGQPIVGTGQEVCRDIVVSSGETTTAEFGNYYQGPSVYTVYLPVIRN